MTSVMVPEGRWTRSADVSTGSDVPAITPNRKRLDRDAPNLAFTITSRKRFVEIVLATDRALFDPARAHDRTPHNFFASRSFGLTLMSGPDATYIAPAAVLRAFLEVQPKPQEIFFTAVAYDDDQGHGPVLALPLGQLLTSAPSVPIASDYTVQSLARSFGVALERLVRHEGTHAFAAPPARSAPSAAPGTSSRWQGSGEIQIPAAQSAEDDAMPAPAVDLSSISIDADGFDRDDPPALASAYEDAPGDDQNQNGVAAAAAHDIAYDDGFGAEDEDRPVGAEPAELPDDDYATSYGDEADEDPHAQGAAANGAPVNAAPAPAASPATPAAPARLALPPAAQLRDVLARVAETLDGHSLYTMARASEAGLRFGAGAFDQRSGALGRVLAQMKSADAAAFARFFGDAAEQLLAVTGAATPQARMADVAGAPLGDASWTQRFAAAGAHPPFVQAQNDVLVGSVLAPLWPVLSGLGLTSNRALATALVFGIHMGPQEAADWLTARLAPAHTEAQIGSALDAIGAPDLATFQRRAGLPPSGRIDAETKAALTFALRALGAASPVPVLTPAQMLDAVRRHAGHGGLARKLASLMQDRSLGDQPR